MQVGAQERNRNGEGVFSRGFGSRRREAAEAGRLPPSQYLTDGFPVLSAGPTPHTPKERWDFTVAGAVEAPQRWTWDEFQQLPRETVSVDIHCVTGWSKHPLPWLWRGPHAYRARAGTLLGRFQRHAVDAARCD